MNRKKLSQALAAPPDSLAGKLVDFLQGNPGECLTRKDIAEKFGANLAMIDSQLAPAVQAKLLVRETDDHDGVTWKLAYPAPTSPVMPGTLGAARAVVKRKPPYQFDLTTIKIEKDVPVVGKPFRRAIWPDIFEKMVAGDSFVIPLEARQALAHAQQHYRRKHGVTFITRKISETECRVWRMS